MKKSNLVFAFYLVFEIGFLLAIPIVVLLVLGLWLDKKSNLFPLFTILGTIIGFTGGILNTYRAVQKLSERR